MLPFLCDDSPQHISKLQTSFFGKQQKSCTSSTLLLIYLRKKSLERFDDLNPFKKLLLHW